MTNQLEFTKEQIKEYASQIKQLVKKAGLFNLTKENPVEPNHELVLQLLDGLGQEVEEALPATVLRKVWAYRYRKYHLFLKLNIINKAVKVAKDRLVGAKVGKDVLVNVFDLEFLENEREDKKDEYTSYADNPAYVIFLPAFATFPKQLQEQCLWFHERPGYANYAKFLNMNKPAINLKFHIKHKYMLKKKLPKEDIEDMLTMELSNLNDELLKNKDHKTGKILDNKAKIERKASIQHFERILSDIDKYEFLKSNYDKGYSYLTLDYRYIKPEAKADNDFDSDQVQVSRKRVANFIFVDQQLIDQNIPNRHKKVHKYLADCTMLKSYPRMNFYYKRKKE